MSKSIEQVKEIESDRSRPYIIFDVIVEKMIVFAILRNEGVTSAKKVKVRIEPDLPNEDRNKIPFALVNREISLITPGRELKDYIATAVAFFKEGKNLEFKYEISYESAQGNRYNERGSLDLAFQKNVMGISFQETAKELVKIQKSTHDMSRSLSRISTSVEKVADYCEATKPTN
jgi:hypothetical protein